MRIKVLGCSTAFPGLETFNQSFLIEEGGKLLLVDCGEDTPKALLYHKVDVKNIDAIYISHLHSDHIGGLPRIALARYDFVNFPRHFSQHPNPPKLIAKQQVLESLWESMKAPLATLQNISATLETYFHPIIVRDSFDWQGWHFKLIQQVHVVSDAEIMPSFGLIIKEGHKSIYLTTDSQYCSPRQIEDFYKSVDIIIQDCELIGVNTKFEEGQLVYADNDEWIPWPNDETDPDGMIRLELSARSINPVEWKRSKFFSGVHANFAQLAGYESANSTKLDKATKAKMWLSHYQDFKLQHKDMYGNITNWDEEAKKEGFAGFVQTGQVFDLS